MSLGWWVDGTGLDRDFVVMRLRELLFDSVLSSEYQL